MASPKPRPLRICRAFRTRGRAHATTGGTDQRYAVLVRPRALSLRRRGQGPSLDRWRGRRTDFDLDRHGQNRDHRQDASRWRVGGHAMSCSVPRAIGLSAPHGTGHGRRAACAPLRPVGAMAHRVISFRLSLHRSALTYPKAAAASSPAATVSPIFQTDHGRSPSTRPVWPLITIR